MASTSSFAEITSLGEASEKPITSIPQDTASNKRLRRLWADVENLEMFDNLQHRGLVHRVANHLGVTESRGAEFNLPLMAVGFTLASACYPQASDALPLVVAPIVSVRRARMVTEQFVDHGTESANTAFEKIFGLNVADYFAAESAALAAVRSGSRAARADLKVVESIPSRSEVSSAIEVSNHEGGPGQRGGWGGSKLTLLALSAGVALVFGVLLGIAVDSSNTNNAGGETIAFADASDQAVSSRGPDVAGIVGTWVGEYVCVQGPTSLVLIVSEEDDQATAAVEIAAAFRFGPTFRNPEVPEGEFTMVGEFRNGDFSLRPSAWVQQPQNYAMVGLTGALGPTSISGDVDFDGCSSFRLTSAN